jgi:benzoate/toluate 1,2-dioxygenase beta subunit
MSSVAERVQSVTIQQPSIEVLTDFIFSEAALLDEAKWDEWLDLFTPEGTYWVPLSPDQPDPHEHVSLFYEDRILMEMRVKRLLHPRSFSLEPPLRTSRLVGNVRLKSVDLASRSCIVGSAFHLLEARGDEQRMTGGFYTHHLSYAGPALKIVQKRVDMINAQAPHEALQVFI